MSTTSTPTNRDTRTWSWRLVLGVLAVLVASVGTVVSSAQAGEPRPAPPVLTAP